MFKRLPAFLLLLALVALTSCSGDDPAAPPVAADVDEYMKAMPAWEEFSPQQADSDAPTGTPPVTATELIGGVEYTCTTTEYSLTDTPDDIVIFSPDSEIFWLGALLQGDGYARGLGSLQELPIRQRAPLSMYIDLLTENVTRTVADPTGATVGPALGELIQAATDAGHVAGSSISFDQTRTHSLEQAALDLNISANYLGTTVSSSLSYEESLEQNVLTAYFVQKMFTLSMVLPQTPGEMFSNSFTQERLQDQVDLGRLSPENPPTYISNIVYGRMLMLTMTSTRSFTEMEAALSASRDGIGSGSVDGSHLQVLQESTIRVASVGGVDDGVEGLIKTGRLGEYFDADAPLTSARPLSYTVRNLGDNSIAKVSETTVYSITECDAVPQDPTGARYRVTLDKLRMITVGSCDPFTAPSPEVYYSFTLHHGAGNLVMASRSEDDYVVLGEGGEVNINSFPREVNLYADGRGELRITGTAWDYDSTSASDVLGNWDLNYNYGLSDGQRYFTRSGNGCSIRLYLSIYKVEDLYD